ncbi:hypothetical protein QVD17_11872 [Tagetes erecta]|uniref:Uncharacterized protein n=1 Tax=Tagetes erecta TaxID=13708 RepID=A0AAD8KV90_TARER|nr:hypothetical protein QVD17_11872 [Tagetes erecta]
MAMTVAISIAATAHSFLTTHDLTLHPTQTLTLKSNVSSISLSISNLLSLITSNHVVVVLICGGSGSVVLSCGGGDGGGVETAEVWSTSSSVDVCRCGPQTADIFLQKKQTAP